MCWPAGKRGLWGERGMRSEVDGGTSNSEHPMISPARTPAVPGWFAQARTPVLLLALLHGAEDLQAETFVGGEDAAVGFQFIQRCHGHAEINSRKGTATDDTIFPAIRFGDLFDFLAGAGIEGHEPFVAAEIAFGFVLAFEPFVAQQHANGATAAGAQPI